MRIRVEIWQSLKPKIQEEIDRNGLTINETVNMILANYFEVFPRIPKKNK